MTLFAFALLADENINPEVVSGLRALGCQIVTVAELGLAGAADSLILERAAVAVFRVGLLCLGGAKWRMPPASV